MSTSDCTTGSGAGCLVPEGINSIVALGRDVPDCHRLVGRCLLSGVLLGLLVDPTLPKLSFTV